MGANAHKQKKSPRQEALEESFASEISHLDIRSDTPSATQMVFSDLAGQILIRRGREVHKASIDFYMYICVDIYVRVYILLC